MSHYSRYIIVGSNQSDERSRVLKIDRLSDELVVTDDPHHYSPKELQDLLSMIDEGNKGTGGLVKVLPSSYGLVGFKQIVGAWYFVRI